MKNASRPDAPFDQAEMDAFLATAIAAHAEAAAGSGEHVVALSIAGVRIDVRFASRPLADAMIPALAGCQVDAATPAPVTLLAFDSKSTGVAMPPPPRSIVRHVTWRGDVWLAPGTQTRLVFHYSDYTLQLFDPRDGIGVFMVEDVAALPGWSKAAPLRSLIGMALDREGAQLVHGAAVGGADGAILVTGYGGSGKSTSALNCLAHGIGFLGDDYVAVRPPADDEGRPTVHNVYASAKIGQDGLDRMPALKRMVREIERDHKAKAILLPFAEDDRLLVRAAPLVACFVARVGDATETRIAPCEAARVARAAFTSTALQIPYTDAVAKERIAASMISPHELILGSDRDGVVAAIATFLDDRQATAPARPTVSTVQAPVSVIMPVHNGAHFLRYALENIHAQQYPIAEVIVVDDGSTDDLAVISQAISLPHTLVRQERSGPAAARNTGLARATGELIAFLDVDDVWPAGNLARLSHELTVQPELAVVHGKAEIFHRMPDTGAIEPVPHVRASFPFYLGAGLYRRHAFDLVGLLDPTMIYGEDSDWFMRAYDRARVLMVSEVTLMVQNHDGNMTLDKTPADLGALHVIKRHLDRRRRAAVP